jgi:riboflavin kinase/FMN adenylyltransferase
LTDKVSPWQGIASPVPCALALGLFDGVHLGHQEILRRTIAHAHEHRLIAAVLSFQNHPRTILAPEDNPVPRLLVSPERRAELMRAFGIDRIILPLFDQNWASTPARIFAEQFLGESLQARHIVVGFNYCFGQGAEGHPDMLCEIGKHKGYTVDVVQPIRNGGDEVSSTRIRAALLEGCIREADRLLGRPHELTGKVVMGDQRGRLLGFPTANLEPDLKPLIPEGVYAVLVELMDAHNCYESLAPGMFFVGPRRTFDDSENSCRYEVHLLNFEGDLYHRQLRLQILDRIRDIVKFDEPVKLVRQLETDCLTCRDLFDRYEQRPT